MARFNSLVIDSTASLSDLCRLGAQFGTDKSPYSANAYHRHPYSAIYDLLFSGMRNKPINFGELGILDNASMKMWRSYFPSADLYGFEYFEEKIAQARKDSLEKTIYISTDVSSLASLQRAFASTSTWFDVLIDDSTHLFEHQILFAHAAVDFVKPGGLIIIEDIFRGWDEERYSDALLEIGPYIDWASFIDARHDKAYSEGTVEPYFDNDKMLVLRRNGVSSINQRERRADLTSQTSRLRLFMATHKLYLPPQDVCYSAVQAGAAIYERFGFLSDDVGDNISSKNPHYSEMTVHYWIWKNVEADFVGLVHYRRFFAARTEGQPYRGQEVATGLDLMEEMAVCDLLVVNPIDLLQPNTEVRLSVESQYLLSHGFDIIACRDSVSQICSNYLPAFDFVMRNSRLIPYNLLVARKDIFDEYSAWLFEILFSVESRVQLTTVGEYQGRVLAFLAERLFTVWIAHNRSRLRLSFRPHVFIPDS